MNLLWVNAGLLLPLDKGGKLRTWHLMRQLARQHDITYVSFADPSASAADIAGMREVAADVVTIPRREAGKRTGRFYLDAARYLVDRAPYAIAKYRSHAYRRVIEDALGAREFEAMICDFLVPIVNLPHRLPCPAILFTHNVESEIWRRHVENAANPLSRQLLRTQWRRMLRFERAALARFDLVLAVCGCGSTDIRAVVSGCAERTRARRPDRRRYLVLRTSEPRTKARASGFHWIDGLAAERRRHAVLRTRHSAARQATEFEATLSIIGRAPTPAVRRLGNEPGVHVTGSVEDVRPHMAEGSVYVARSGLAAAPG